MWVKPTIFCGQAGISCVDFNPIKSKQKGLRIFKICIPDQLPQLPKWVQLLNEKELNRAKRYHKKEHQQNFIICRGILKWLLFWYTGIAPKKLELNTAAKPFLVSHPKLHFNISHSGNYCLIAFNDHAVGIDLEKIDPQFDFKDLLPSVFSSKEQDFIKIKPAYFYTLWTRKEAIVKALGTGLTDQISQIPVLNGNHLLPYHLILDHHKNLSVISFSPSSSYSASLACTTGLHQNQLLTIYNFRENI